jgi:hypothetical protein
MKHKKLAGSLNWICLSLALLFTIASAQVALAQTTAFTYQGKLSDNGGPAGGQYDFQFKLFDTQAVGTGTQQGGTVTASNVTVANGIFTVQIDFGAAALPGASRFLEIAVKPILVALVFELRNQQSDSERSRKSDQRIDTSGERASRKRQLHSKQHHSTAVVKLQHFRQRNGSRQPVG